jgi:putative ABC transport system ATP-binding protein
MITIDSLCKHFTTPQSNFHALSDITLRIKAGEVLILKGVSGSGKSTLLCILAGVMKPSSGKVMVAGENIATLSDIHASLYRKHHIGFVTQNFHLFERLTVTQNLLPALVTQDLSSQEIAHKITKALHISNISHKANQKVSTLSGGEKQRCVIARALVNEPEIILCDEPTANLDHENSLKFIAIIKKLKELNKTIIIATHDPLFEQLEFVDSVISISEGRIE